MGTRTWSRRGVLTAAGRRRAGLEAINIFGEPIPDVAVPEAAAFTEPPSDIAEYKSGRDLTNYLYDESTYPPNTLQYFQGDLAGIFDSTTGDISTPEGRLARMRAVEYRELAKQVDLDPDNPEHQEILISLFGINPNAPAELRRASTAGAASASKINGALIQSVRMIDYHSNSRDKLIIENQSFKVNDPQDALPGMGYTMLRRQAWAARRLGEITGKEVIIKTSALSGPASSPPDWSGAHVWPKLGYTFDFDQNRRLRETVSYFGFTAENSADLMTEKLPNGQTGYDAWPDIVRTVMRKSPTGSLMINGYMNVTDDNAPGLQVMQNYGKRKKLSKGGEAKGETGFNLTAEDNVWLKSLWQKFGKGK